MKNIRTAVIGLGGRGSWNCRTMMKVEGVEITALCDVYQDRVDEMVKIITEELGRPKPFITNDYHEILGREDVDVVMVFTSWETHVRVSIDAMKAGHAVGMEVGGAYNLEECYELVETYEKHKVPFMLLENCCYGRTEMLVRNLAKAGVLGEIVHCHGAYGHDLRKSITAGKENRHYRLRNYLNRNCENYPTHELGPISKIIGINRGNRMVRLVSMSSKAAGIKQYIANKGDELVNKDLIGVEFKQGDVVNTLITCENGETISIKLDTTLPRPYSREFTVAGTKGIYEENTNTVFLDGDEHDYNSQRYYKKILGNAERFEEEYLPECWKNVTPEILTAGHGGMDYFTFKAFFECLREGKEMPIDVYDAAAWMCITCLSEQSIAGGNIPIEIPDFTKGAYKTRPRLDV